MEITLLGYALSLPVFSDTSLIHFYAPLALLVLLVISAVELVVRMVVNKLLAVATHPYSRMLDSGECIGVFGDSTAVGTGSKTTEESLAGRLARDFPHTSILNRATNGSITRDVLDQIRELDGRRINMAIISTGGNDIWKGTSLSRLTKDLRAVLQKANEVTGHRVILLFFGNEGSAPFFPWIIRVWLARRTAAVEEVFLRVAGEQQVPLINLFSNPRENPFVLDPDRFFARDRLHPSGAGYGEWYKRMWRVMVEKAYLFHESGPTISGESVH